tara:strand:+ start:954 stop:1337 length:384 start_codon:yes stop_codon:yes gene_type:complete
MGFPNNNGKNHTKNGIVKLHYYEAVPQKTPVGRGFESHMARTFKEKLKMRFLEEKIVKIAEDMICQKCGKDILEGNNAIREKYTHRGKIITTFYCNDKKCNPPNDVGHRLFMTAIVIVIGMFIWIVN